MKFVNNTCCMALIILCSESRISLLHVNVPFWKCRYTSMCEMVLLNILVVDMLIYWSTYGILELEKVKSADTCESSWKTKSLWLDVWNLLEGGNDHTVKKHTLKLGSFFSWAVWPSAHLRSWFQAVHYNMDLNLMHWIISNQDNK